jgi:F-type H+-transporting ATPase subunit delta
MQVIENTIAKKYAIAFLNLFEKKLTIGCLKSFESFSRFLDANKLFSATLSIPSISLKNKIATLEIICTKQNINPLITKIIILLLRNKRIEILDKVIKSILFFHKKRLQVQKFIISTSHTLDEKEKEEISFFIKRTINDTVKTTFIIDKHLISGVRIKSDGLLWERSIAKRLRSIRTTSFATG